MEFKTNAIMLRAVDYKENDKILTLFTPTRGKVVTGIRGVKKPKAKLAFCAQPFSFCEYVLAEKNGRYTVTSAYLYDGFYGLRTDITRYYAACATLEICNALLMEEESAESTFIACVETLKSLSMTEDDSAEILLTFALRALFEAGYPINLDGCGICGESIKDTLYFDFELGTFTCSNCMQGERASRSTYEVLRKCDGLEYDEDKSLDGKKRALRLVKVYLSAKTEEDYPCFGEFIRLYE
jgi:DNA repair protein RecO (recombination protein O)